VDSDVVLVVGPGDFALGHVVLSRVTHLGVITFSGALGGSPGSMPVSLSHRIQISRTAGTGTATTASVRATRQESHPRSRGLREAENSI
jgi:hypothetical protein